MTDVHTLDDFVPVEPQVARMTRLAAFRVTGNDREEFLQGQLSNDIRELQPGTAQLTSYSNPKGRVLAIMRLANIQDDWWLLLDASVAEPVMQRLKMFVLRADVTFERDENFGGVAIVGHSAGDHPGNDKLARMAIPGSLSRVELFGRLADLPGEAVDADELRRWDTLSGLLQVNEQHSGEHVAQMLNLDRLGAIHFRKGCYAGQEVIARMHYLGKLKKRALPCFSTRGEEGDAILTTEGRKAGVILQSSATEGGRLHLAMLNLADIETGLRLDDGSVVTVLDTGLGHVAESTDATQAT